MVFRGRRFRGNSALRAMLQETIIQRQDLVMPYFVVETNDSSFKKEIPSMPGQYQHSLASLRNQVEKSVKNGLYSCLIFGVPAVKNDLGSSAYDDNGIVQKAVSMLKKEFPEIQIITDVCLCAYTTHGHCGVLTSSGDVDNESTLPLLANIALSHARAGADIVSPSDMMDGRVDAIRCELDKNGFNHVPIMSYAVKYASSFYGPFREAADSSPAFGDRRSYQMNPANRREAFLEAAADEAEGADILMVKPAGPYLDIIRDMREFTQLPLAAYQVSGEYSMIKAAGQLGWVDSSAVMLESLISIKRAGADLIISYFTEEILEQRLV